MSNMDKSKYLYPVVAVNGNLELDYFDSALLTMRLQTIDTFRITRLFEYRPDLISEKFTGSYNYGWLIARHNDFIDPIFDYKEGILIKIPDFDEYFRFFNEYKIRRTQ